MFALAYKRLDVFKVVSVIVDIYTYTTFASVCARMRALVTTTNNCGCSMTVKTQEVEQWLMSATRMRTTHKNSEFVPWREFYE